VPAEITSHAPRARLFRKYVAVLVGLVSAAVISSGLVHGYFAYQASVTATGQIDVNGQLEVPAGGQMQVIVFGQLKVLA